VSWVTVTFFVLNNLPPNSWQFLRTSALEIMFCRH
jgi:hypothetical protein